MQTPQTSTASLGFWPSWAHHIGDLVFGANDGIITTFAVVSGVSGAALSPHVAVILRAQRVRDFGNPQILHERSTGAACVPLPAFGSLGRFARLLNRR